MADIQIDDRSVRAALLGIQRRLDNITPVLQDIGEDITHRAKARFDTSTGPDGTIWRPKRRPHGRKALVGERDDLRQQIISNAAGTTLTPLATAADGPIRARMGQLQVSPVRAQTTRAYPELHTDMNDAGHF